MRRRYGAAARRDRHDRSHRVAEQINVQFEWVPAYLFQPSAERAGPIRQMSQSISKEATSATELGFDAELRGERAILGKRCAVDNQAKFHPRKYLIALLRLLSTERVAILRADNIDDRRGHAHHGDGFQLGAIHCEHVLFATHVPLQGKVERAAGDDPSIETGAVSSRFSRRAGWRGHGHERCMGYRRSVRLLRVDRRHDHDFVIFGGEDTRRGQV